MKNDQELPKHNNTRTTSSNTHYSPTCFCYYYYYPFLINDKGARLLGKLNYIYIYICGVGSDVISSFEKSRPFTRGGKQAVAAVDGNIYLSMTIEMYVNFINQSIGEMHHGGVSA